MSVEAPVRHVLGNRLSGLTIRGENRAYAVLFLVPTAVLFVALVGYPVVYSLALMFTGRSDAPGQLGPFVGLENWARLGSDPLFVQSALQTLMYVIPSGIVAIPLGLAVALILNERFPGRRLARAALLIPWALPPVVVAAMFQWLLDSRRGLLGVWLENAGIVEDPPIFFAGVPGTLFMLTAIHIWKTFPLIALIILVSLQYLPQETIQAARIDGASRWRRFRHITLPFLRPTLVAAVIIEVLVTVQLFDLIFALTGGGPGRYSTYNLYFYAFKTTFELTDFGYGSVLAYIVTAFVVVLALTVTRGRTKGLLS